MFNGSQGCPRSVVDLWVEFARHIGSQEKVHAFAFFWVLDEKVQDSTEQLSIGALVVSMVTHKVEFHNFHSHKKNGRIETFFYLHARDKQIINMPNSPASKKKAIGTRTEVWNGVADHTSGGLRKSDLKLNKQGKIVSVARSQLGKERVKAMKQRSPKKTGKRGGARKKKTVGDSDDAED